MDDNSEQPVIRVFISGPYSNGDSADNVRIAMGAGDMLLRAGLVPFIPHLAHFWHIAHPHTYNEWLDWCLAWVSICDCVLRLPGHSQGADQEISLASALHIPVYHDIVSVIDNAQPRRKIW